MDALFITAYGAPLQFEKRPRITAEDLADDQVLIKVHTVAINPVDIKISKGSIKAFYGAPTEEKPLILGADCAGVIEALGKKVDPKKWNVGDRIICVGTYGALAEYTRAHISTVAKLPDEVSFQDGAAIITAGMTAFQMLSIAEQRLGDLHRVLITAGGGGVGHMALQLAKRAFGVETVITTASPKKHDFVQECGADEVIDYTKPGDEGDYSKLLADDKVDAALDCIGEGKKCKRIVRPGGMVVTILGIPDGEWMKEMTKTYHMKPLPCCATCCLNCVTKCINCGSNVALKGIVMLASGDDLQKVAEHCAQGALKPHIDKVFPLKDAVNAFEAVEGGHTMGKILVEVRGAE